MSLDRFRPLALTFAACLLSSAAFCQYTAQPSTTMRNQLPVDAKRPVSISGQVVLEDGTPSPEPVEVLRVCGSMIRRETYTNAKGKYSIILDEGSTNKNFQGASEGGGVADFGAQMGARVSTTTRTQLWGCEIRASLPGFTSSGVSLEGRDFSVPITLSPIVLHRATGAAANSISAISAKAPENARKEFDKARDSLSQKKYEDADKHLAKAIEIYPQYATALDLRGREQRLRKEDTEAEKSFLAAITADEKYLPPYMQLATMNAAQARWPNVELLTSKVIEFDPLSYPDAFFLNAFAHFNMNHLPEAEASAKKAVDMDKEHHYPRAVLLLGKILQKKGDNERAAEQFRAYLKLEPSTPEAAELQAFAAKYNPSAATAKSN